MVQTFQGHFQEGRFVSPQTAEIPEYVEVVVVVTGKVIPKVRNSGFLSNPDPGKSVMLGKWNGEITIPDDFKEPLDEMKEYMY